MNYWEYLVSLLKLFLGHTFVYLSTRQFAKSTQKMSDNAENFFIPTEIHHDHQEATLRLLPMWKKYSMLESMLKVHKGIDMVNFLHI